MKQITIPTGCSPEETQEMNAIIAHIPETVSGDYLITFLTSVIGQFASDERERLIILLQLADNLSKVQE